MRTKIDTPEVRARLQEIMERADGPLTAEAVVEDARDESSPLHSLFPWDDKKAAALYRLDRAREIIRVVTVEIRTETVVLKAPVYIRDPDTKSGYDCTLTIRDDSARTKAALEHEMRLFRGVADRILGLARVLGNEAAVKREMARAIGVEQASVRPVRAQRQCATRPAVAA